MNKTCKIIGCNNTVHAKGICAKHKMQISRYGKILKRSRFDPNKFIIKPDYCLIELYNVKHEVVAYTIIDLDDVERCKNYKWHLKKDGYVATRIKNKAIFLHNFILNRNTDDRRIHCDHDDGNPLNNTKNNLTIRTCSENIKKAKLYSSNTSGIKNIYYDKKYKHWGKRYNINEKKITKFFKTRKEAIEYTFTID